MTDSPVRAARFRAAMLFDGNELYGLPVAVANLLAGIDRQRIELTGVFLGSGCGYELLAPLCERAVCLETGPVFPLRRAGRPKYDPLYLAGRAAAAARSVRGLARLLRRETPEILHFHSQHIGRLAWWATRRLPLARVWHCHGSFPHLGRREAAFVKWVQRAVDRVAAISGFVRDTFPEALRPRVRVQYNCVQAARLRAAARPGEFRARFAVGRDAPLVGIFGSVVPIKGHRYFIEAAARVAREMPGARFAIVGGTTDAYEKMGMLRQLQEQIAAAGIADRVIDTGFLPDATGHMCDFDVIAMPSVFTETQRGEGFGMVMIEAMAQGVPVIATRCGAPPEVIEHGVSGLLVPPRDGAALGEAMLALLRDAALRRRIGQAGMRRVDEQFDSRAAGARLVEMYEELAETVARRRGA